MLVKIDKRKGVWAGHKHMGPTGKFLFWLAILGLLGCIFSFVWSSCTGATRSGELKTHQALARIEANPPMQEEALSKLLDKKFRENFPRIEQGLSEPTTKAQEGSVPGLSIHCAIRLHSTSEPRRKFIFDMGEQLDRNRLSLYLDERDNLCFRLLDSDAESHLLKISRNRRKETDKVEHPAYLVCEYGGGTNRFLRLFANGHLVSRIDLDPDTPLLDVNQMCNLQQTIGCDLTGKNCGTFDISRFTVLSVALDSNGRTEWLEKYKAWWTTNMPWLVFKDDKFSNIGLPLLK